MRVICAALVFFLGTALSAQQHAVTVPEVHQTAFSGSISGYSSTAPDIVLTPKSSGARPGRLWIRNTGEGLLIVGDIQGGPANFPHDQNSLFAKDHVEIWLAADADPILPPVGWGNQFGETQLPDGGASCSAPDSENGSSMFDTTSPKSLRDCRQWAATQNEYRRFFQRLFLRQWILAPGHTMESFATPAFQEISSRFAGLYDGSVEDESPDALKPSGNPKSWFSPSPKGYTFQVLIPYTIFPPLPSLNVTDLRLVVDVFSSAPPGQKSGAHSSSSRSRVWADPDTFNHVILNPPRVFHMTPCDMPLAGRDLYGTMRDAWFIPHSTQPTAYQSDAFLIVNEAGGYWYDPKGLSPIVHPVHDFWTGAGPGEWVCGPQLTHTKDGRSVAFDKRIDSDGLATRHLPNGDLLVKSGPFVDIVSRFGAGECGSCSYTSLEIFRITPEDKVEVALKLGNTLMGVAPFPLEEDFNIAPDWSQVTDFQESSDQNGDDGPWSSVAYCLEDLRYSECGKQDNVTPPKSALLNQEEQ